MKRTIYVILAGIVIAAGLFLIDPSHQVLAPKCPVWLATGLKCPGCGSQRMFHHLLHGRLGQSFTQNPLLFITLPYFALLLWYGLFGNAEKYPRLRNFLLGRWTLYIIVGLFFGYMIVRNVAGF